MAKDTLIFSPIFCCCEDIFFAVAVSLSLLISIFSPGQATVILFRPLGSSKWGKLRICL